MKLFRVYGYAIPEAEPEQVYFVVADDSDEAAKLASNHPTARGLTLQADANSKPLPKGLDVARGIKGHVPPAVFHVW
jgi:hypothetical protein